MQKTLQQEILDENITRQNQTLIPEQHKGQFKRNKNSKLQNKTTKSGPLNK